MGACDDAGDGGGGGGDVGLANARNPQTIIRTKHPDKIIVNDEIY